MNALAMKEAFDIEAVREARRGYKGVEPGDKLSSFFSHSGLSTSGYAATPISGTLQLHENGLAFGTVYQFVGNRNRFDKWKFDEGYRAFDQVWTDGLLFPEPGDTFCHEYTRCSIAHATFVIVFGNAYYPSDYYGDTWVSQYWLSPNVDEEYVIARVASLYDMAAHYQR